LGNEITYKPFGEQAILIEWQSIIDDSILTDIISFKEKVRLANTINIVDLVQSYTSLTIIYNHQIKNFKAEVALLKSIYETPLKIKKQAFYKWHIPVCYNTNFGLDLEEVALKLNISVKELVSLHSSVAYRVCFIGFLPGFFYLGGLPSQLHFNRKPNPRLLVPKGSVGIGGEQTGVYPTSSAGGWNIIGKTPIEFFNAEKNNPCFAKPGDFIEFNPISLTEYQKIEKQIAADKYQITKTVQNA
jgi:inhibitor of KinA